MSKDIYRDRIIKLVEYRMKFFHLHEEGFDIPEDLWREYNLLLEDLIFDHAVDPGHLLVYMKDMDPYIIDIYQDIIDLIWKTVDMEEMLQIYLESMPDLENIANRIRSIISWSPVLISFDPNQYDFDFYYREIIKALLSDLSNSALILCCSLLENILRGELYEKDIHLVYDISTDLRGIEILTLDKLIDNATKVKLLSDEDKMLGHKIRKMRNAAIHDLKRIPSEEIYVAVNGIRELAEKLLGESKHSN
jgi:hypothetical protein